MEFGALWAYRGRMPDWVALLRTPVHDDVIAAFSRIARGSAWLAELRAFRAELLVLAPQSRKRGGESGLNAFARNLMRELEIPELIPLTKEAGKRQHGLDLEERMDSTLFVRPPDVNLVRGKRVLLLDDVWTTGTTMEMSAFVLREAGVSELRRAALVRQVVPCLDRESKDPDEEGEEGPVFLTHFTV